MPCCDRPNPHVGPCRSHDQQMANPVDVEGGITGIQADSVHGACSVLTDAIVAMCERYGWLFTGIVNPDVDDPNETFKLTQVEKRMVANYRQHES